MNPGDIVMWRDEKFGHHRFWEIQGVFLGAEGQEGVIELKSLTERPAHSHVSREHPTTFVPEPLLRNATIYTPQIRGGVIHGAEAGQRHRDWGANSGFGTRPTP